MDDIIEDIALPVFNSGLTIHLGTFTILNKKWSFF